METRTKEIHEGHVDEVDSHLVHCSLFDPNGREYLASLPRKNFRWDVKAGDDFEAIIQREGDLLWLGLRYLPRRVPTPEELAEIARKAAELDEGERNGWF